MSVPEWRTVAEQSEQWRCSRRAVHAAIARGDLVATMIGGRWLIDPADAAKYEAEHRNVAQQLPKRTRRPKRRVSA